MRYLIFVVIAIAFQTARAQSIENLWRARGLEALDKIKVLRAKGSLNQLDTCKIEMEAAYGAFVSDATAAILINKKDEKSVRIRLMFMTSKDDIMLVNFLYDRGSVTPQVIMPGAGNNKSWTFYILTAAGAGTFVVENEKCSYEFLTKDYFNPAIKAK